MVASTEHAPPGDARPGLRSAAHHVSGGRFILGLGAGGVGFDSTVFARPTELSAGQLVDRLQRIRGDITIGSLRELTARYEGVYYSVERGSATPGRYGDWTRPRVPLSRTAASSDPVRPFAATSQRVD